METITSQTLRRMRSALTAYYPPADVSGFSDDEIVDAYLEYAWQGEDIWS